MSNNIAIIGVGLTQARPVSPDVSFREMIFEAATKAYDEANVEPSEIDTFIPTSEDFIEGVSIFDEYTPDQLGARQRPVHTIAGEAIQAIAQAYMQIATGYFKIAVVECHSKASNILFPDHIEELALDPVNLRHLRLKPNFLVAMDMNVYLNKFDVTEKDVSLVISKAKRNAMKNDFSCYPAKITSEDILCSEYDAYPLRKGMIQNYADGACVIVLAEEELAKAKCKNPIWIKGISFYTGEPCIDSYKFGESTFTRLCADAAYKMAKIKNPKEEISFFEIDDRYGYKFFVHADSLKITNEGEAAKDFKNGIFEKDGKIPVNLSSGYHGLGEMHGATCGYQLAYAYLQLKGIAGKNQLKNPKTALIHAWKGFPSQTGSVVILSN